MAGELAGLVAEKLAELEQGRPATGSQGNATALPPKAVNEREAAKLLGIGNPLLRKWRTGEQAPVHEAGQFRP